MLHKIGLTALATAHRLKIILVSRSEASEPTFRVAGHSPAIFPSRPSSFGSVLQWANLVRGLGFVLLDRAAGYDCRLRSKQEYDRSCCSCRNRGENAPQAVDQNCPIYLSSLHCCFSRPNQYRVRSLDNEQGAGDQQPAVWIAGWSFLFWLPLTPIVVEAFRDQLRLSPCSPYLFPSDENRSGHQRT